MSEPVPVVVCDGDEEVSGTVREGESWAAAAQRIAPGAACDPEPADLSGTTKKFLVDHLTRVALRPMTLGDLDDVVRWRADPAVLHWWADAESRDVAAMREKYAVRIEGSSPTRMWVVEVNGRSVGFVQDYRIGDYPDYALLGPDPDAIGLDYAIGAPEWRGRGLGHRVIWCWMRGARARFPDARTYFAAPDHRNAASLRVLAKAGFVEGLWFDEPNDSGGVDTVVGCTLDVRTVIG